MRERNLRGLRRLGPALLCGTHVQRVWHGLCQRWRRGHLSGLRRRRPGLLRWWRRWHMRRGLRLSGRGRDGRRGFGRHGLHLRGVWRRGATVLWYRRWRHAHLFGRLDLHRGRRQRDVSVATRGRTPKQPFQVSF
jgi:hypothetical protein